MKGSKNRQRERAVRRFFESRPDHALRRVLEMLPGVGPGLADEIMQTHLGSRLEEATQSEWGSVRGIGPKRAAKIMDAIHPRRSV